MMNKRGYVIMGVAGVGKTTLLRQLEKHFPLAHFLDSDELHTASNKAKLRQNLPLDDEDRWPWLRAIRSWMDERKGADQGFFIACSALKRSYRDFLGLDDDDGDVGVIWLSASLDVCEYRLGRRIDHALLVGSTLAQSQLDTLEPPLESSSLLRVNIGINSSKEEILKKVLDFITTTC